MGGAAKTRVGLDAIERESERRGRELVRLALQAHLDARGDGDVGPGLVIGDPSGPLRLGYRRHHTRRLLTVFGEVSVTRLGYDTPGHQSIHPLDAELGLPGRTYSYEICRRLARAAVVGPFDEATALIAEMTGVVVPKRSAATTVVEAAVDFEAFYAARTKGEAKPMPREILVGAIDCKGIPMVKPEGAHLNGKVIWAAKGRTKVTYRASIEVTGEWKLTNGISESNNAAIGCISLALAAFTTPRASSR